MEREQHMMGVSQIDARAHLVTVPCGGGMMPVRRWPGPDRSSAAPVVLIHGGSGSWTHWIRNIEPLATVADVVAPDLPGLGDAAALPPDASATGVADCLRSGLDETVTGDFHLVAFSWGCIPATIMAAGHRRVRSLTLIGSAGLGRMPEPVQMQPLIRRTRDMTAEEIDDTNRENLARLMIHDRNRIDDLAVYLQTENTSRSRFNSPPFARTTLVLDHLDRIDAPVSFLYGDQDATAKPNIGYRRELINRVRADARFDVFSNVGHWVQYEAAERFNAHLAQRLGVS